MKRALLRSLGSFAFIGLCALVASKNAAASCKVMESRNAYLGYSALYGFSPALSRIQNPYNTMLASKRSSDRVHAKELLNSTLSKMGIDGGVSQAQPNEVKAAEEQLGAQMLSTFHQADYALIYGSERIKADGSILVAYQEIELNGAHAGERVEKILQIKRQRAVEILGSVCRNDRCNVGDIMNDPEKNQTALKTVIGIEITHSLKLCRS